MSNAGRPRALDEFKRREVCALVSVGCGIDGAARYVGCNATTIRREALRNPEFHEQLRNAELKNQLDPLRAMRKAADTHWRAAAWLLERTHPDRFARRPPECMSPDQVDEMLAEFFEQLLIEMPNPEPLQRVMARVQEFVRSTVREERAATHTRHQLSSAHETILNYRMEIARLLPSRARLKLISET
jgi:hypothetical protein